MSQLNQKSYGLDNLRLKSGIDRPNSETRKPKILVVSYPDNDRSSLTSILKSADYAISRLDDISSLYAAIQKEIPDLVLLDDKMSGWDTGKVCQKLREDGFKGTPVICAVAQQDNVLKKQLFAAGCADVISRPFVPVELLARVDAHIAVGYLQRRIQEETDRYRALESAAFHGIFIHRDGVILEVSDTMAEMVHCRREEIIGRKILDFIAPSDHARVKEALSRADGETRNIIEGVKRDGSVFPIEVQGNSIQYKGRPARVNVVRDLSTQRRMEDENLALRLGLDDRDRLGSLVGRSLPMRRVYNSIVQAAASNETAVIYGETGTGKDLAARMIHELSSRSSGPFVTVNCSTVQESIFESMFFGHKKGAFTGADASTKGFFKRAEGGVLFLDEIGEFTPTMQAKLLRVLQDGEFTPLGTCTPSSANVRILSASNKSLVDLVESGHMREDFYQRIHVIPVEMPPLRNHREDLNMLVDYFTQQVVGQGVYFSGLPDRLMDQLIAYDWPGNVRELFNVLRRYHATGQISLERELHKAEDIDDDQEAGTYHQLMENFERRILAEVLSRHNGNSSKVVQVFGIPRKTLQRKIRKYNL